MNVANPANGHAGAGADAISRPRILLLDTDLETRNHYIVLAIRDALARHPAVDSVVLPSMLEAIAVFRAERCDHFLAVGSARAQAPLLARLCALARGSVLWTTEDPYELAANLAHAQGFDHIFTNDLASVAAYGGRASHLPLAASRLFQNLPVLPNDADYRYDLLFIGTAWPNRVAAIDEIIGHFPRARAKIGLSTNPHLPPVRLSRTGLWTGWRTGNAQFARLANVSRVTLGLERRFSAAESGQAKGSTPPPRLFEVALAGGYQVFLADGEEAACYFESGREFALCADMPAVIKAIGWALANPTARIARAAAAREHALRAHLYDHRVGVILQAFRAIAPPPVSETSRARRVLVVTHNVLGRQPGGGVEVYQELLRRVGPRFSTLFLYPDTVGGQACFMLRHPGGECDRFELPYPLHDRLLHDPAAENLFQRILFDFRIDLVHYQHLLHFPLSLPLISHACGVPAIFTLHDHHLICSRLNLLDYRGAYCDPAGLDPTTCDICLSATDGLPAGAQVRRRNFIGQVLRAIDLVVANTPGSLEYLSRIYPDLSAERATVVEMCLPAAPPRKPPAVAASQRLRVVVPGNFTDVKGGHQLVRLFNLMRDDAVSFTILGTLTPPFPDIFDALRFSNVRVHGGYASADVFNLLAGHDMSLHLSIWPETYVISLSEAWASGLVPIVSRLGALGERVTEGWDGFVVDPYDIGRTAALLRRFAEDRDELRPLAMAIADKPLVGPARHLAQLRSIYERLIERQPVQHATAPGGIAGFHLAVEALGIRTNHARWDVEDHRWDEPLAGPDPAPAPPALEPGSGQPSLLPELPSEPASIADRAHFSLDRLAIDDLPFGEAIAVAIEGAPCLLQAAGWSFRPSSLGSPRRLLRLRGDGITRHYRADAEPRPDIAALFEDRSAVTAGFRADIRLDTLPGGSFWLDVLAIYPAVIVEYRQVARLDLVAAAQHVVRRDRPLLDGKLMTSLPSHWPGLPKTTIEAADQHGQVSLDRLAGDAGADDVGRPLLSTGAAQSLTLVGWAFHPAAGLPLDAVCRLRGSAGDLLFALGIRRRRDVAEDLDDERACEGGFAATLTGMALPTGAHALDLLQVYDRQIVEFPDVAHLMVLPGR